VALLPRLDHSLRFARLHQCEPTRGSFGPKSPYSKRHIGPFIRFYRAHADNAAYSLYWRMGLEVSHNFPLPRGPGPHLTHGSSSPPESTPQTTHRSAYPFLGLFLWVFPARDRVFACLLSVQSWDSWRRSVRRRWSWTQCSAAGYRYIAVARRDLSRSGTTTARRSPVTSHAPISPSASTRPRTSRSGTDMGWVHPWIGLGRVNFFWQLSWLGWVRFDDTVTGWVQRLPAVLLARNLTVIATVKIISFNVLSW